jgi:hypothetical protein
MSAAWPGLSAGIAVVDVEGDALVSCSETAHKAAMAARFRERPTAAGAPADRPFTQRGVSRGRMGPPSLPDRPDEAHHLGSASL